MKNTTRQTEICDANYKVVDVNNQEIVYTASEKEIAEGYMESLSDDSAYAIFFDEGGEWRLVGARIPICRFSVYEESVYGAEEQN